MSDYPSKEDHRAELWWLEAGIDMVLRAAWHSLMLLWPFPGKQESEQPPQT